MKKIMILKMTWKRFLVTILILIALVYPAKGIYTIMKWRAYIWFPSYVSFLLNNQQNVLDEQKHVIFIMVDHYEPGKGEHGSRISEAWL